jgi:glycyl-tRNA synthetase (class II)
MQNSEINRDYYYVTSEVRSLMQDMHRDGYTLDDISELTGFSTACIHRHINNVVSIYGDHYKTKYDPDRHTHGSREHQPVWDKPSKDVEQAKAHVNRGERKTMQVDSKAHSYISLMAAMYETTQREIVDEMVRLHMAHTRGLLTAANED